jgi:lipopolysaccharide transport system ATP-binding protein
MLDRTNAETAPSEDEPKRVSKLSQAHDSAAKVTGGAALRLRNVNLKYPLGPLLRRSIKSELFSLFGSTTEQKHNVDYVEALKSISFSITDGERVAVIGQNGSGKSTLLRALAGVLPINAGEIRIRGRVQGLFDIGLGFEPEATGRENILYRGLVMGLSPTEVALREAEIVAFADIGDFIDLPVRTYSAGMGVRLAFAISTYLQGDILLLDEMLGAGDAAFQAKAYARMMSLVDSARILILVTHDMGTAQLICPRTIWLRGGEVVMDGPSADVIKAYLEESAERACAA